LTNFSSVSSELDFRIFGLSHTKGEKKQNNKASRHSCTGKKRKGQEKWILESGEQSEAEKRYRKKDSKFLLDKTRNILEKSPSKRTAVIKGVIGKRRETRVVSRSG